MPEPEGTAAAIQGVKVLAELDKATETVDRLAAQVGLNRVKGDDSVAEPVELADRTTVDSATTVRGMAPELVAQEEVALAIEARTLAEVAVEALAEVGIPIAEGPHETTH